jgi:hypothetical protein
MLSIVVCRKGNRFLKIFFKEAEETSVHIKVAKMGVRIKHFL